MLEAMIRKKYVAPLVWVQPYVAAGIVLTYLTRGRFSPGKNAVLLEPANVVTALWLAHPSDANGLRQGELSPIAPQIASLIPAPGTPAVTLAMPTAPLAAVMHAPAPSAAGEPRSVARGLSLFPSIPASALLANPSAASSGGEGGDASTPAAVMLTLP